MEFCHKYLAIPSPSADNRIIHVLQQIVGALASAPPPSIISQVDAIANLWDIFESWSLLAPPNLCLSDCLTPGSPRMHSHVSPRSAILLPPTPTPLLAPTSNRIPPLPPSSSWRILHPVLTAGQATPRWLDFGDTPTQPIPMVLCVTPPSKSCPPLALPTALPMRKPISRRTCSRAQALLALFTSG